MTEDKNVSQSMMQIAMKDVEPYSQEFLQERKSKSFLDAQLYEMHSTCFYHEGMPYCPIQAKIQYGIQKFYDGACYLIQVWNADAEKVYEVALEQELTHWTVCYNYFIFKPNEPDNNHNYYHLVNLDNDKYLAYNDGVFYIANSNEIKLFEITDEGLAEGEVKKVQVSPQKVATIVPEDHRIHGLFLNAQGKEENYILAAFETPDFQIDYNEVHIINKPSTNDFKYLLKQFRELVPRKGFYNDPVKKLVAIFQENDYNYSCAIRKSNEIDLYYNAFRVFASDEYDPNARDKVIDARVTFDTIYLRFQSEDIKSISLQYKQRIGFDYLKLDKQIFLEKSFYQNIKKHCKTFNSFCLVKRYMIVVHGRMLSQYHILKQRDNWIKHLKFDQEIQGLFRMEKDENNFDICVLLKDGSVKYLKLGIEKQTKGNTAIQKKKEKSVEVWNVDEEAQFKLHGDKVLDLAEDRELKKWALFYSYNSQSQTFKLQGITQKQLYDLEIEEELTDSLNFEVLFNGADKVEFVVQDDKVVYVYQINLDEDMEKPTCTKVNEYNPIEQIESVHSALKVYYEEEDEHYVFLMDNKNFYKLKASTHECEVFEDQNCVGLYFSDSNYLYALCHKSATKGSGLRLYDIKNVIAKNQPTSYQLENAQVGSQGIIDFSKSNQRVIFQSSLDNIEVLPLIHRNTICFIGMQRRELYLAARVIYDTFVTLNNENTLISWDVLTGILKYTSVITEKNPNQDYSGYQIYQYNEQDMVYKKHWFGKVLLRSKEPVVDFDEDSYFEGQEPNPRISNRKTFIKQKEKQFYRFKLIEIISDDEVKEHCSFIHPYYMGSLQQIYFNENADLMFERLVNQRHFIYKKVQLGNSPNEIKWEMFKRLSQFPSDFLDTTQYPTVFCPDFSQYLDLDRFNQTFVIRDTLTQQIQCRIPETLMTKKQTDDGVKLSNDDIKKCVINRFAWVDNKTFRIISIDGIERIIDPSDNLKELEYNVIPEFNLEWSRENHFILDRRSPSLEDTYTRLLRKYQTYKSAYYLRQNKENNYILNQDLFNVDFGVDECQDRYIANLSFTFFHWCLIEQLEKDKIDVESISEEQIQLLAYNILPNGDTALHKLHTKGHLIEAIYQVAHPDPFDKTFIKHHIPFLPNFDGDSPINLLRRKEDYRTMNSILEYLSAYGVDHHSRVMVNELPSILRQDLPSLVNYLDSRLQQTKQSKKIRRGMIRRTDPYGVVSSQLWFGQETIEKLFQKAPIEQQIELYFADMPYLHTFTEDIGQEFFLELAETKRMEFFEKKAIKKLIEFKWPLAYQCIIIWRGIPFLLFMILYLIYVDLFLADRYAYIKEIATEDNVGVIKTMLFTFQVLLCVIGLYLNYLEFLQFQVEKMRYFMSIWNYLDITPSTMIIIFFVLDDFHYFENMETGEVQNQNVEAVLLATMSLCLWLKLLYFLRFFQSTGYLIRIIFDVVIEMKFFLFILLLTIVAFADSLLQINGANEEKFMEGGFPGAVLQVFYNVLGELDDNFGEVAKPYAWFLFITCCVFNLIIMLNLLIAIISEAFARINAVSNQASYQEKAAMIAENIYLISDEKRKAFCDRNTYMLLAVDQEQELREQGDPLEEKFNRLETYIQQNVENRIDALASSVEKLPKEKLE